MARRHAQVVTLVTSHVAPTLLVRCRAKDQRHSMSLTFADMSPTLPTNDANA